MVHNGKRAMSYNSLLSTKTIRPSLLLFLKKYNLIGCPFLILKQLLKKARYTSYLFMPKRNDLSETNIFYWLISMAPISGLLRTRAPKISFFTSNPTFKPIESPGMQGT